MGADFALVAKAPSVEWVRAFRKAADAGLGGGFPVFMWFWDPIDYGEQRRMWFEGVAPFFDLVLLNEKALLVLYSCFTGVLLMLYSWFTCAGVPQRERPRGYVGVSR